MSETAKTGDHVAIITQRQMRMSTNALTTDRQTLHFPLLLNPPHMHVHTSIHTRYVYRPAPRGAAGGGGAGRGGVVSGLHPRGSVRVYVYVCVCVFARRDLSRCMQKMKRKAAGGSAISFPHPPSSQPNQQQRPPDQAGGGAAVRHARGGPVQVAPAGLHGVCAWMYGTCVCLCLCCGRRGGRGESTCVYNVRLVPSSLRSPSTSPNDHSSITNHQSHSSNHNRRRAAPSSSSSSRVASISREARSSRREPTCVLSLGVVPRPPTAQRHGYDMNAARKAVGGLREALEIGHLTLAPPPQTNTHGSSGRRRRSSRAVAVCCRCPTPRAPCSARTKVQTGKEEGGCMIVWN